MNANGITRVEVQSSAISALGYGETQDGSGILLVEMQGNKRVYAYVGVDRETYEEMLQAPSIGAYYAANIKNKAGKATGNRPSVPFNAWPSDNEVEDATGASFVKPVKPPRRAGKVKFKKLPRLGDFQW